MNHKTSEHNNNNNNNTLIRNLYSAIMPLGGYRGAEIENVCSIGLQNYKWPKK